MTATVRPMKAFFPRWTSVPGDPVDAAGHGRELLQSGRIDQAMRVLERLPDLITAKIRHHWDGAYVEGRMAGEAAMHAKMRPKPPPAPTGPRRHEWLHAALADPDQRATARAAVRLIDQLLDQVAAGRLTLSAARWRRLREALT